MPYVPGVVFGTSVTLLAHSFSYARQTREVEDFSNNPARALVPGGFWWHSSTNPTAIPSGTAIDHL